MYKDLNKEQWLTIRKTNQLPAELIMEYCNKTSNAGFRDVKHFIESFSMAGYFGAQSDLSCVTDYFDRKYGVNILRDKQGNEMIAL
jgi:hypothetical protein